MTQMQSSSPSFLYPSTPSTSRNPLAFRPLNSSPLVELEHEAFDTRSSSPVSPKSSPLLDVQARRKSQYKSIGHGPTTPTTGGRVASGPPKSMSSKAYRSRLFSAGNPTGSTLDSQKAFIRDRFMARCLERATNARERAIKGKRSAAGQADDAMDLGNDQEENDEFLMQDELFRRILRQTNRSQQHAYQVSYYDEVGSSFDPDLEDIGEWERELSKPVSSAELRSSSATRGTPLVAGPSQVANSSSYRYSKPLATPSNSRTQFNPSAFVTPPSRNARQTPIISNNPFSEPADPEFWNEPPDSEEYFNPAVVDDEELEAYAEEYAKLEAIAEFDDIPEEELFDLQWYNASEETSSTQNAGPSTSPGDDDMDLS